MLALLIAHDDFVVPSLLEANILAFAKPTVVLVKGENVALLVISSMLLVCFCPLVGLEGVDHPILGTEDSDGLQFGPYRLSESVDVRPDSGNDQTGFLLLVRLDVIVRCQLH